MKYIRYLLLLFPVTCIVTFIIYFIGNSTNHTSIDFLENMYPLSVCAIIAVFSYVGKREPLSLVALVVNLLVMLFFYCIDEFNVMVEYDKWQDRGMPAHFSQKPLFEIVTEEEIREREEIKKRSDEITKRLEKEAR